MTDTQKTIHTMKQQPILSGVFAVILVLMLGVAAGYAAGFDAPAKAYAQLVAPVIVTAPVVAPVVVPPPVIPVIVPVITPVVTPVVTAPATEVSGVTVTGSGSTDTDTVVGGTGNDTLVSGVTVTAPNPADQDHTDSPCCTQQDTGNTISGVTVTAPVTTPDIDITDSPCCTVQVTTPSVPVVPTTPTTPVIPPVIPPVVPPTNPPENPNASCTYLRASVSDINPGDAVTLTWATVNNTAGVSISNAGTYSNASGSVVVYPTGDTTYQLTIPGKSPSSNCVAAVHIRTVATQPKCVFLTADKDLIKSGEAVKLTWKTENATSITINNGGGSFTDATGSTTVYPTATTTYTAVVKNANGVIASEPCQATVRITTTTTNNPIPTCNFLTASETTINPGDEVVLTWDTLFNPSKVTLNNGIGDVTPVSHGTVTVKPTSDTTYTAQIPGEDVKASCQVTVKVTNNTCTSNCGGGGGGGGSSHHSSHHSSKPDVLLSATGQPLASVYLSQIPYTGLDLGPVGTALYWIMLVLWSLAAAYLILFGAFPYALRRIQGFGSNVSAALNQEPAAAAAPEASVPAAQPEGGSYAAFAASLFPAQSAPTPHFAPVMAVAPAAPAQSALSREGFKSFASGDALTIDDIVKGLSRESGMVFSQHVEAEEAPAVAPVEPVAPVAPVAPVQMQQAAPAPAPVVAYSDDVSSFLGALLSGDRETVFGTLRSVNRAGGDAQEFLAHAVCALDDAYRARTDGTPCHPEIARITNDCATSFLERMVSSLATAIDSSYSAGITGAKLAVTRALSIVNG